MPAPEAPVIASVSLTTTRDDVYAIYRWTADRTPAMQRLIRRNRRMQIGVITAFALAVPGVVFYLTYTRGKSPTYSLVVALVFGAINAALLVRSARKHAFGADATRAGLAKLIRKGIDAGDHDASLGPCEIRVTDHDLIMIDDTSTNRFAWVDCEEAEFTPDEINLFFGPQGGARVPLRAFNSDAARDHFVQACVDRLPDHVRTAALADAPLIVA